MAIHEELQRFWEAYVAAYRAADALALGAMFTHDAELHSPYAPPARGRDEIAALHATWTEGHGEAGDKEMRVIQAGVSGQLAWSLASYSEGLETGNGTSVSVFEQQGNGSWLIRMCSLNSTD
ncbi:nuclear transport factor 2 family protein [Mesorhizobium sp. WSM3860]|uniref:YybH family protein n=1 Tax=Mesorhizobium sp. WSM3860 TaxID=2029403 RepID=UPI000BB019C9|nr:nuclear transport factor 2 family protein [Mesorhizobium sp. WSM3860]PBC01752.1 hypothetical protein CK220_24260 [Mesorhizobium sp. WSM3860]